MEKKIDGLFKQSLSHIMTYQDSIDRLNRALQVYESKVGDEVAKNSPVIGSKVEGLFELARKFLKLCRSNSTEKFVPYCLAAVDYLVNEMDAIEDFNDYDGFDDDEYVFKKVISDHNLSDRLTKVKVAS